MRPPSTPRPELPVLLFEDQQAWTDWLAARHADAPGVWLRIAKKASGLHSVTFDEALDIALCYGWIDGQRRTYDAAWFLQKFTPRGPKSLWSQINTGRVERLIAAGRMQPAGLGAVESAKQDGRWDAAYAPGRTMAVPADLEAALDAHPAAAVFFATLNRTNRYAVLWRIETAKRPATRAKRIADLVRMLEEQRTFHT